MERTYLDVPSEMNSYAHEHGAKYDIFRKMWYIEGEVNNDLINFLPEKNKVRIDTRSISPNCPICDAGMELKQSKNGDYEFWGCSRFSNRSSPCRGTLSYDIGLDHIEKRISEIEDRLKSSSKNSIKLIEHKSLIKEIANDAKFLFNDENTAALWLQTSQAFFSGKSPSSLMLSYDGCIIVREFIKKRIKMKFGEDSYHE